mmetsp:Transcript_6707/g.19141  ORF Transcript_6707/g.19141 Transcript_6707/m.19141 type:complete len:205 (+) Transcript_6707:670-1284(+)
MCKNGFVVLFRTTSRGRRCKSTCNSWILKSTSLCRVGICRMSSDTPANETVKASQRHRDAAFAAAKEVGDDGEGPAATAEGVPRDVEADCERASTSSAIDKESTLRSPCIVRRSSGKTSLSLSWSARPAAFTVTIATRFRSSTVTKVIVRKVERRWLEFLALNVPVVPRSISKLAWSSGSAMLRMESRNIEAPPPPSGGGRPAT